MQGLNCYSIYKDNEKVGKFCLDSTLSTAKLSQIQKCISGTLSSEASAEAQAGRTVPTMVGNSAKGSASATASATGYQRAYQGDVGDSGDASAIATTPAMGYQRASYQGDVGDSGDASAIATTPAMGYQRASYKGDVGDSGDGSAKAGFSALVKGDVGDSGDGIIASASATAPAMGYQRASYTDSGDGANSVSFNRPFTGDMRPRIWYNYKSASYKRDVGDSGDGSSASAAKSVSFGRCVSEKYDEDGNCVYVGEMEPVGPTRGDSYPYDRQPYMPE